MQITPEEMEKITGVTERVNRHDIHITNLASHVARLERETDEKLMALAGIISRIAVQLSASKPKATKAGRPKKKK